MGPCFHSFKLSPHACYEVCETCESYRRVSYPEPAAVYTSDYWTEARGHSTFDDQVFNVDGHIENGQTKVQSMLRLLHASSRKGAALEIGCAPGVMLKRLGEIYPDVHGIEVPKEWGPDIHRIAGFEPKLHFGLFPDVTRNNPAPHFDLVVAMDVFEHSPAPWPFIAECGRLLHKGGQLLMMAPLVTTAYPVPERMFCEEHIWIHSLDNLAALLWQAGFHSVQFDSWTAGHEIVSAIKGDVPDGGLRAA